MGKRFAIVIAVATAGVMALGAQTATAEARQTVEIDSKVTLAFGCADHVPLGCALWRIHGRVEARTHACEVQRPVKYFVVRLGPDKLSGKDETDDDGRWQLLREPHPGFYYAKVVRREVGTAGATFVCRHDRTATFDAH